MARILYSNKAHTDLLEIWSYIAEKNIKSADKLLDDIAEKCILISKNPKLG